MLNNATGFKHIYIATGYTDLRKSIDGLAMLISTEFKLNPYDEGSIFLFCGKRNDRIKALVFEGDGFLLMYKRLVDGKYKWPRPGEEVRIITEQQYCIFRGGGAACPAWREPRVRTRRSHPFGTNVIQRLLSHIETGLKKFAAIVGDNVEVGCQSVLNPGTVIGRGCRVYPLSRVRGVVPEKYIFKDVNDIVPIEE